MPDPDTFAAVIRTVQPAARLLRIRHLRKARQALGIGGRLPLWVPAERLPELELIPAVSADGLPAVLLLPAPDDLTPRPADPAAVVRVYWRMLIEAEVLRSRLVLPPLGADQHAEVRAVLARDGYADTEAAAVVAGVLAVSPERFADWFPLLAEDGVPDRLAEALGTKALAERFRPPGATTDPPAVVRHPVREQVRAGVTDVFDALRRGNVVRAAVQLNRAGDPAARALLRERLVAGLAARFGWDAAAADRWHSALLPLLTPAGHPDWGRGVRCLYDLQRILTDGDEPPGELAPFRWLLSLGRRPLREPVPLVGPVRTLRHLARATDHLHQTHLPAADRDRLAHLLDDLRQTVEADVRRQCEPRVREAVTAAGLRPADRTERLAVNAVAAELVDQVAARGFARFSDLRDAVARNALKLPDLSGPGEWWRGDALLRADRTLGTSLRGVYRPGEGYLRGIHRVIAAAFGTAAGRWLSLWLLLPFGGGVMAVEFAKYVALELSHLRGWVRGLFPADAPAVPDPLAEYFEQFTEAEVVKAHSGMALGPGSLAASAALGLVFLALIHSPPFRRRFVAAVGAAGRLTFVALPRAVWESPAVRWMRAARLAVPAFAAGLTAAGLAVAGAGWPRIAGLSAATFVVLAVAVRTPLCRRLADELAELAADGWRAVRYGLLPGLVQAVVDLFRLLADRVERGLYAVDEWLRFRPSDGGRSVAVKAAAAAVWQPLAYLVRFVFYLLVEPQVNPVKHFPVVTVSHKLLLPAVPSLSGLFGLSLGTTGLLVSLIPGVFGFIAWELKEGWRLYRANRPAVPPPRPVGHHGETVRGLLVPGFHRGTVPKLFARLRHADDPERQAATVDELHHVEHAVGRFIERHLVAALAESADWQGLNPVAGPVRLGVRTLDATLAVPALGDGLLQVRFATADDTVTAEFNSAGWHARLSAAQADALGAALGQFCAQGGAANAATAATNSDGRSISQA